MKTGYLSPTPQPPVVLGVALTIAHNESLRRSLNTVFGTRTRAISLQIDPGMDLIFLCETTIPCSLPCLASLTEPGLSVVTLRSVQLEWQPDPDHPIGRGTSTLAALESGSCFLSANSRKIAVATFSSRNVHPTRVNMELHGHPNLLDYLRNEFFTLEISGTNRRRLTRPLAFKAVLEFDLHHTPSKKARLGLS